MPLQQVHVRQKLSKLITINENEKILSSPPEYEVFLAKALVVEADEAFEYKRIARKQS
jgi:hypothetical protein